MKNGGRNCTIKGLSAVFVLLICLFASISLVGCDKKETVSDIAYYVYLAGCSYDDETLTVTAYTSIAGSAEQRLEGVIATGKRRYSKRDLFYNFTDISVTLDGAAIYDAVRAKGVMSREADGENGQEGGAVTQYLRLQVVMRYDTIYKSIVSNGVRHPSANGYTDLLPIEESGEKEFVLTQRSPNSANWYSLLMAAGIVFFAALMGVYLAYRSKKDKSEALPREVAYAEQKARN